MNEKINWSDLKKATALRCNSSEKEVGQFMNALVEAIREGLVAEGNVRVNGLGTFSVKPMAARKSVNVNTGEEITIAGYNKVSFQAEAAMKDTLRAKDPTSVAPQEAEKTEPVEKSPEEDPIKKIGEQATEILDLLAELRSMETSDKEQAVAEDVVEPVVEPEVEPVVEPVTEPVVEPVTEPVVEPVVEPEPSKGWKIGSIVVLVLAVLLVGGYLAWGYWADRMPVDIEEETEIPTLAEADDILPDTLAVADTLAEADTTTAEIPAAVQPETRDYSRTITVATLNKGSRLTLLAERYYGNRDLWVFLYEANQDKLPSPHRIAVGTEIRIPELDACWKDTTNATTKAEMARLKEKYEAMR